MEKPDFYRYHAIFTYEEDGVHVVFPDLPGCVTFGKDEEEYFQILYDRIPTLPQSLRRDYGMLLHLWRNIAIRLARDIRYTR